MKINEFEIIGEPKAQKRHRHFSRGKFSQTYDPSSDDKKSFIYLAYEHRPETPYDFSLRIKLIFYFPRPKAHFKSNGDLKSNSPERHFKKPDIDNLIKFILDSLNKVFWRDDALITDVKASKQYSDIPRIKVEIYD